MSEIKIIRQKVHGIIKIVAHSQYNNVSADEIHVGEGVTARVYGSVRKSVHLAKGSRLFLHGSFDGELINNGGELTVF